MVVQRVSKLYRMLDHCLKHLGRYPAHLAAQDMLQTRESDSVGETRRRGLRIIENEFCEPLRAELRCDMEGGGEGPSVVARWREAAREGLISSKVEALLNLIQGLR